MRFSAEVLPVGFKKRERGFTLVELMIVLAVAAVLIGLAVPSMSQFILSGKLRAYTNELVARAV